MWRQLSAGSAEVKLGIAAGGLLKKGSYTIGARLKGASAHMSVRKNAVDIEAYGLNVSSSTAFSVTGSWALYTMSFIVDDETADYRLRVNFSSGSIDWDCVVLIPISNSFGFVYDIIHQILTINNAKNIGVL